MKQTRAFIGGVVAPRDQRRQADLVLARDVREVTAALKKVRNLARRHTDSAIIARVDRVGRMVSALATDVGTDRHVTANWETIRQIAMEYLPATLHIYVRIPKAYRQTVRKPGGKTAHHELVIQLNLLARKLSEIAANVGVDHLDEMQQYSQFLEARFRDPVSW
ncbi:MAG: hypothetical protein ACN4GZ_03710 [Acidimicrobiales bacterium]